MTGVILEPFPNSAQAAMEISENTPSEKEKKVQFFWNHPFAIYQQSLGFQGDATGKSMSATAVYLIVKIESNEE